jgi:hypothetical protein
MNDGKRLDNSYGLIRIRCGKNPKMTAELFCQDFNGRKISYNQKEFETFQELINKILSHPVKSYVRADFINSLDLTNDDYDIAIRGHPSRLLEIALFIGLNNGYVTVESIKELSKK